jgi:hypothetical protein
MLTWPLLEGCGCVGRWPPLTAIVCQVAAHRCGALATQLTARVSRQVPPCFREGNVGVGRVVGWTRCWVLRKRARFFGLRDHDPIP